MANRSSPVVEQARRQLFVVTQEILTCADSEIVKVHQLYEEAVDGLIAKAREQVLRQVWDVLLDGDDFDPVTTDNGEIHIDSTASRIKERLYAYPERPQEDQSAVDRPEKVFTRCGLCRTWNTRPCGEQCGWNPDDPERWPK